MSKEFERKVVRSIETIARNISPSKTPISTHHILELGDMVAKMERSVNGLEERIKKLEARET